MFPEQIWIGVGVTQSLMMTGHREEALSTMEKTAAMRPGHAALQGFLAWAYGAAGLADKAKSVLEQIQNKDPDHPPPLTWLEKALDNRDFDLLFMPAPEFRQGLATEPRYQQLLKKLRLEGSGKAE